ncbi:MAG: Methyltransferase type 11 [uncultured bacterium]|nr:MAG: Methyltransferase type 11 [uncultured bacterium]
MLFNEMSQIHGFSNFEIKNFNAWLQEKIDGGKIVAQWGEDKCLVFGNKNKINVEFKELLEEGKAENTYQVKGHIPLHRLFSLFAEGIIDFLVHEESGIEFPVLAHELMEMIYKISQDNKLLLSESINADKDKLKAIHADAYLLNLWGKLLTLEKKYNEAGMAFRGAVEINREFGEPYGNLGTLLWGLNKQREGFFLITEALLKNPYSISTQLNFFDAGYELREFSGMAKVIESVLPKVNEFPEFRHHLAICYQRTGRSQDAVSVLQKILNEFPGDEEARNILNSMQS